MAQGTNSGMSAAQKRAHDAYLNEVKLHKYHQDKLHKPHKNHGKIQKRASMTIQEKRAHDAQIAQETLDIDMASNQLEAENSAYAEDAKREKDAEELKIQNAKEKKQRNTNRNKQILNAGAGVAKAITPDSGKSSFKVGSLDISWGLFFLLAIVFLWMTVSPAPGHSSSRLGVMWKAFIGQEQIA